MLQDSSSVACLCCVVGNQEVNKSSSKVCVGAELVGSYITKKENEMKKNTTIHVGLCMVRSKKK